MSILQLSLSIPVPPRNLSSSRVLCDSNNICLIPKVVNLTITRTTTKTTPIRMGGGPRTFPGGVSKWQWKRMQASKAKQLLKARLARERQIYEMRKRAELKAAVTELERPWEVVERAPKLFSVKADEQVKVLADRFQRPGGFDMWSDNDGPELFTLVDGLPSARFFPKGVVHSVKPYGKIKGLNENEKLYLPGAVSENDNGGRRSGYRCSGKLRDGSGSDGKVEVKNSTASSMERNPNASNTSKFKKHGEKTKTGFKDSNKLNELVSGEVGVDRRQRREAPVRRNGHVGQARSSNHPQKLRNPISEVTYDMSLHDDGSYGF